MVARSSDSGAQALLLSVQTAGGSLERPGQAPFTRRGQTVDNGGMPA